MALPCARGGTSTRWTLDIAGGYDDQVLADPDRINGLLEAVGQGFYQGSTRFLFSMMDRGGSNRLDLGADASATGYGSPLRGDDTDLRMSASYRHRFGPRVALDALASGWRFRRRDLSLYDLNMVRAGGRLAWNPGGGLLLTAGATHHWAEYPGRPESTPEDTESHRLMDLSLGAAYRFGRVLMSGDAIYRRNEADIDLAQYRGPVLSLRARSPLGGRISMAARAVHSRRLYEPTILLGNAGPVYATRRDEAWQIGVTLDRPLNASAHIFLDATYLDQRSSVETYSFDQTRVSVGISVDLLHSEPALARLRFAVSPPAPLRPSSTPSGVRFRFRAPQAREVSVVGGFNAWNTITHPLADSDRDGVWEVVIPVSPGIWRYAFVVDGKWVSPQDAPRYEEDGFGGRNGVIEVEPPSFEESGS